MTNYHNKKTLKMAIAECKKEKSRLAGQGDAICRAYAG